MGWIALINIGLQRVNQRKMGTISGFWTPQTHELPSNGNLVWHSSMLFA